MNWYYASNGTQKGPLPTEDLKSRLAMGEVSPTDLAWREGMSDWMPISSIPELKVEEAPPKPVHPTMPPGGFPSTTPQPEPYQAPAAAAPAPVPAPMGGAPSLPPSQGMAIASLVCGILALLGCCFWPVGGPLALVAIVLGHIAISKVKRQPDRFGGKGMATGGLITGYLGLIGAIVVAAAQMWMLTLTPEKIDSFQWMQPQQKQELKDRLREFEEAKQPR